jgi:D-methionine transport system substrate-binding protein
VRAADKDKPFVQALVESYRSPEIKTFVADRFKGSILPSW